MSAALLVVVASLGAEFAWPTWISGVNSSEYLELSLEQYPETWYTGPIKVRCGYSGVRRMPPHGTYLTLPCDGYTSLSNSAWVGCAGADESCQAGYLFPVVVLQASSKESQGGMLRASIVWDYVGPSLPCSGPDGKPSAPCDVVPEDVPLPWYGTRDADGPFEGIPSPNVEGCISSDYALNVVEAAIEVYDMCQPLAAFYLQGIRYVVIEHGVDYCETWLPLEGFMCDGYWEGGPQPEGEGGGGGTEGELPTGDDWRSVVWDPIDASCGAAFPAAETRYAIPIGGVNAVYARPDGSVPVVGDENADSPPTIQMVTGDPQGENGGEWSFVTAGWTTETPSPCRSWMGTNVPRSYGVNGGIFKSQGIIRNNPETEMVRIYADDIGDTLDTSYPGETLVRLNVPNQGVPAGVFLAAFFGGGLQPFVNGENTFINRYSSFTQYEYGRNSVAFNVGNLHDVRTLCKPTDFVRPDLDIPPGGDACSWKAADGTLLGWRTRAQLTRVSPVDGDIGQTYQDSSVLGNKPVWLQRIKYPNTSENSYDGWRVYLKANEQSEALGHEATFPYVDDETGEVVHGSRLDLPASSDGWFRLMQPEPGDNVLGSTANAVGTNALSTQYQMAPQPYPEGFGVGDGAGGSGGRPWWEADGGEVLDGLAVNQGMPVNTGSMSKAVAEGTAIGIGLAANTLASKIASAVSTGVANLTRSKIDELTFDAPESETGFVDDESTASTRSFSATATAAQVMTDSGLVSGVEGFFNRMDVLISGSASYAPVFTFNIPFFGENRSFTMDFRMSADDQSAMGQAVQRWRSFIRAIVLVFFILYFIWCWVIPMLFGGWPWSAKASEVTR